MLRRLTTAVAVVALAGCTFYARGPEDYRKATRELLDGQAGSIRSCYERELKRDDKASGKVVVRFDVEPKTGNLVNAKVVDDTTTATAPLQKCVLDALDGLKLDPPDQRKGEATFEWEFAPRK